MSDTKHYLYRIKPKRPEMLVEGLTPHESETMAKQYDNGERSGSQSGRHACQTLPISGRVHFGNKYPIEQTWR